MSAFASAGMGFLLAVIWFDLMHDVQVRGHEGSEAPEPVLASIAGYYARVTTGARPMNRLVAVVMAATLVALVVQVVDEPGLPSFAVLAAIGAPVGLAGARTVGNAVRLGGREDTMPEQSRLARSILRDHVACFALVTLGLAIQLWRS